MKIIINNICDYGCGQLANYKFKNGKYCCLLHSNKCSMVRQKMKNQPHRKEKRSEESKLKQSKTSKKNGLLKGENNGMYGKCGELNSFFGKTHTKEQKEKWKYIRSTPEYKNEMSNVMKKLWKEEWFIKSHRRYTDEEIGEVAYYYKEVWKYTNRALKEYNDIINPNDKKIGYKDHHIDHMYSIYAGLKNEVDAKIIGSWINLAVIPWNENLQKNRRCSITLKKLRSLYENSI